MFIAGKEKILGKMTVIGEHFRGKVETYGNRNSMESTRVILKRLLVIVDREPELASICNQGSLKWRDLDTNPFTKL